MLTEAARKTERLGTLNLRVVVVDDSEVVVSTLCEFLRTLAGIQILGTGSNGVEAIGLVRQFKPDVVLMDVNMPQMNGIVAMAEIRKERPCTHVILISSSNAVASLKRDLAKASGFIRKNDLVKQLPVELHRLFSDRSPTQSCRQGLS
jgi:chemotaxis response regulator CheB